MIRKRMIVELDQITKMAIPLRAIKDHIKTGAVIERIVAATLPDEWAEAVAALKEQKTNRATP